MGNLTSSAGKAFKKGTRRAHVPEWFQPLSYVVGAIAGTVLMVSVFFADDPVSYTVIDPAPANPAVTSPDTGDGNTGTQPTSPTTGTETTLDLPSGQVTVPGGALAAARLAAEAIFTGRFENVTIYGGANAPDLLKTWPNPVIAEPSAAESFPDGSWRFTFPVDPDGAGAERTREVGVYVAEESNSWSYIPG